MKFDGHVKQLVEDFMMAFYITKDISHIYRHIDLFSSLATELMNFLIECCIRIRAYSLRSSLGKTASLNMYLINNKDWTTTLGPVVLRGEKSEIEECKITIKRLVTFIDYVFVRRDITTNNFAQGKLTVTIYNL